MRILLTNDDGYKAKGIKVLTEILRSFGDITVVAPKRPQSGASMSINMGFKPLAAKHLGSEPGIDYWYLDATPSSCIKFGLDNVLYPEIPDLVVSGINHGCNAATAALYSGTLGAAMEGALNGVHSIGVSLDSYGEDPDFSAVEELLPDLLRKLLPAFSRRHGEYYNINFPDLPASEIKGVKICRMGMAHWEKEYQPYLEFLGSIGRSPDEDALRYIQNAIPGEEIYVMSGCLTDDENEEDCNADHRQMADAYITVTPHNIDNTDRDEMARLAELFV